MTPDKHSPEQRDNVQLFNLATMSGVFPGTRTQIYQRLRLKPLDHQPGDNTWARLLWYADPAACVVYLQDQSVTERPLLQLLDPLTGDLSQRLSVALQQAGWQMQSCGNCHFWQPTTARNADGISTGFCQWHRAEIDVPAPLATQSMLALDCPHWQGVGQGSELADERVATLPLVAMRKAAEVSESKLPYWKRLAYQVMRWGGRRAPTQDWAEKLLERSGVGAGTEACFVCQGRIANLGALAVETDEGDKQTFSIWRCRSCYTTYLNNWIDRWERLETLETEETYYRITPAEALTLLMLIDSVEGGDHPGRRRERQTERRAMLDFTASRTPLSHQIRQGR